MGTYIRNATIAGDLDIDVPGSFDMLSTGVFSIDGTGASNVTVASGNLTLATTTSGNVILTSAGGEITCNDLIRPAASAGAASTAALLIGVGTTADPATTGTASKNFLEFRTQTTATSGDSRALYIRHDFNGAGVAGEGIRSNCVINADVAGTVNGAHLSAEIKTGGGAVSGACQGVRAGLLLPNAALSKGTVYGAMSEIWSGGASSDVSGATKHAIHSFQASGNATGAANVLNCFSIDGIDASGDMIYENVAAYANWAGSIRILVNGAVRYIKYDSAEA